MSEQSSSPAEQRANAVAKLKRAASLPRMKNGRRPPLHAEGVSEGDQSKLEGDDHDTSGGEKSSKPDVEDGGTVDEAVSAPPAESQTEADQAKDTGTESEKTKESETEKEKEKLGSVKKRGRSRSRSRSRSRGSKDFKDSLRPSDSSGPDEHAPPIPMYSPLPSSMSSPMSSPYPMLAPSLGYYPSPSPLQFYPPTNPPTPNPLPSFETLIMRTNLMRSNSAAARMTALQKLTGGRETPETNTFSRGSPSPDPSLAAKLSRSRTVAGGERLELRSKMLKQLGKRVNAADISEDQISGGEDVVLTSQVIEEASKPPSRRNSTKRRSTPASNHTVVVDDREPPVTAPSTPAISLNTFPPLPPPPPDSFLPVPPRPTSRASSTGERERDSALAKLEGEESFEFDAHLRRSPGITLTRGVFVEEEEEPDDDDVPLTQLYRSNLPQAPRTPSRDIRIPFSSNSSSISTSTSVPIYLHEEGQTSPYKEDAFPVTISPFGTPIREKPPRDDEDEEEEENERVVYQEDMGPRKAWLERTERDVEWNVVPEPSTSQPLHNGIVDEEDEDDDDDDDSPPPPPPKDYPPSHTPAPILPHPIVSDTRESSHPSTSNVNSPSPGARRMNLSPSPSSAVALSQSASTQSATDPNVDQRASTASSSSAVVLPPVANSLSNSISTTDSNTSTIPGQQADRSRSQSLSLTDWEDVQTDREINRMSRERDRNDRDKRLKKEPSTLWQKAKETITGRRSRSNSLVSSKREAQDTGVRESSASGISASSGGGGGGGGVGGGGHVGGHIARSPSTISLAQIQSQMTSPSTSILTVTSPPPKEGVSHIPPVSPMDMEKYHNPKLISFPGIVKLEEERRTRIRNLSVSGGVPEVNTGAGGWTGGGTVPSTRRNSPEPHRGLVHQASDSKLLARYQASGASNTSGFHTSSSSNTLRAHARQEPPSPGQEYFDRPVTPSSSSKLPTTLVEAKKWITQHTQRSTKNRVNGTTNGNDVGTAKANGHPPRGSSLSDLLARKDLDSGTEKEDLSRSASHSGYTYKATVPSKGSLKVRQERERVEAPTPDPSRDPFSGPLFGQVPRGVSPYANGSAAVHREKPEIKPWDDTNNNASPGNSPTDVVFGFPSSTSTILSGFATSSSVLLTSPADSIPSSSTASAIPVSTPTTPSDSSTSTSRGGASPSSQEVLQRLDALLNSSPIDPNLSNFLDEPPRILLFSTAIKMVHSPTEVKNRYLFIFNDILVIAKANEDEAGRHWTERSFSVKNILELGKIQMEIPPDPRVMSDFSQLPVVKQFSRDFHYSPDEAIVQFLETTGMKHDPSVIGSLLFEVVSLSKTKLGQYLSKRSSKPVLKAFVDKFAFAGVRIDEALRAFLLAMRLPTESSHDMEHLLIMFSSRWYEANKGAVLYEKDFAIRFVFAMMQLNDALHSESHSQSTVAIGLFSFPNLAITPHDFIQALRSRDSSHALSDNTLDEIYRSIADEELLQAAIGKTVPLFITPSLPERLTMLAPSLFTIQIPSIDPYFRIDLIGQDLTFEPKTLEFSSSNEATFQVTGSTTGQKTMLFVRKGFNAPLYTGLPLSKEFAVVRSFMQDTFIINFRNNENVKKKHMVHVPDPIAYNNCCRLLREYIDTARAELPSSSSSPSASSIPHQLKRAAQAVAVQVLRDSLIVHDEPSKGVLLPALSGKNFPLSPSFAVLAQQARGDPNYPYRNPRSHSPSGPSEIQRSRALSGLDLTLACRQNSLIPFILTFMQVIKPPDVDPVGMGGIDDESRKWRGIRI